LTFYYYFEKGDRASAKLEIFWPGFAGDPKLSCRWLEVSLTRPSSARPGIDQPQIGGGCRRFSKLGMPGIEKDASRPERMEDPGPEKDSEVIQKTPHTKPGGATYRGRSFGA